MRAQPFGAPWVAAMFRQGQEAEHELPFLRAEFAQTMRKEGSLVFLWDPKRNTPISTGSGSRTRPGSEATSGRGAGRLDAASVARTPDARCSRAPRREVNASSSEAAEICQANGLAAVALELEVGRLVAFCDHGRSLPAAKLSARADVAELVDAHGSGPCGLRLVEVQVLSSALRPKVRSRLRRGHDGSEARTLVQVRRARGATLRR